MKRCNGEKGPVQPKTKIWRWGIAPAPRWGIALCAALVIALGTGCTDSIDTAAPDTEPKWTVDAWTASPLPAISGVDWDALDTGKDTPFLNAFEKEAIAWYNLAKVYPQKFYQAVADDEATAYAKNTDLQSAAFTNPPSSPSKALLLAAREYASLLNSAWEFDCGSYRDGVRGGRYVDGASGFFGLPVDLEGGGSPKLLVAKAVRICGEWGNGSFVGITRQGNYGILIVARSVTDKADLPATISYGESRIDGASTLTDFTDTAGKTFNVRQIALDAIGTEGTDREKIHRVNAWLSANLAYAFPAGSSSYDGHPAGHRTASSVLAYATLPEDDPAYWRWCVCEGYARTMVGMLREVGVRARTIAGFALSAPTVAEGGHDWVQVYAEGVWTMCDPTWDDWGTESGNSWIDRPGVNGDDIDIRDSFLHSTRFY
jgi:hypothetical protein